MFEVALVTRGLPHDGLQPGNDRLHELRRVERLCGRPMSLASEDEIGRLFPDCEFGSVPPVGAAYGLPALVDDALAGQSDLYLEAGDHLHVLHVTGEAFAGLMRDVRHGRFSVAGPAAWA